MSIICTCGKASGFACNGAAGCPLNATDGMPAPKTKPMSNNPNSPLLPDDRRFKRGDKVSCGTTTVLVSGDGDEDSFFAGVVIDQTNNEFPYHFPVGQYSRSWIAINFKKSELKAQPGAVWVKASTRLPAKGGKENSVIVRGVIKESGYNEWPFVAYGYRNLNPEKQQMYFELGSRSYLTNDVEWLDESPAEQPGREVDARDFAEWLRLYWKASQNGWVDALGKWETTHGLYLLFKGKSAEWSGEKDVKPGIEIKVGLIFRNVHMPDYSFTVVKVTANFLDVSIVHDTETNHRWTESDWILEHTQWAFEKGEYYIEKEVKGENK